ncbi:MAG: hypothetical protein K0Q59_554 [Paenibacillus sp.]|jgi:phage tail-like protein|nr:hypothetical protein [Paenibacillus sp.]
MRQAATFFSFNKPSDWEAGRSANMSIRQDGVTIERTEKYAINRTLTTGEISGADDIADFAVGSGSKMYVLDINAALWVHDYENRHTEPLYGQGHRLFTNTALLAAAADTLYIADCASERRIGAISPSNGQLVWAADEWDGLELFPLAVAVDSGKRLYTAVPLDYRRGASGGVEVPQGGRIIVLQWSVSGEVIRQFEHAALRLRASASLEQLRNRFYISVSHEGEPIMLDSATKSVIAFLDDGTVKGEFVIAQEEPVAGIAVDADGELWIGDAGRADAMQSERFIHKYLPWGEMSSFVAGYRSRADKLLHDGGSRMYVLDRDKQTITLLDLQARTMAMAETGLPEAWYVSEALDSAEEETVWHKIELLADIPEETQIRISYFATDEQFGVLDGQVVNYSDYFADPDIPLTQKWMASRHLWSPPIVNPHDALLMQAKGKYLRFRIELVGSDQRAPVIRRLRVVFPRQSPIAYLPPIYQEDTDGSGFLERFLALFGTFLNEMEEKISKVSANFDPDSVSGTYLKWLSGWLALDIADGWDETKLRTLIKQAPELYKQRGTRLGLARMLRIYTGVEPFIVEQHQLKSMQESSELRQMFNRLYGDNPYVFCVMLPPECVRTDKQRLMVEAIITDQKPAYTEGKLVVLQPWMHTDMHTYLGINTVLAEPTVLTLDEISSMPHHTVLIDPDRDKRIDIHTRLELDSELE